MAEYDYKSSSTMSAFVRVLKTSIILLGVLRTLVLKTILFLLSCVLPKNDRVLFFSSVGNYKFPLLKDEPDFQFKESPKYLAIYTAKQLKDFIPIFHVPNKRLFHKIQKIGIQPTRGMIAFWHILRAKYIFIDNKNSYNPNASFLSGRFKIIQCWHGTPLKRMGEDRKSKNYWLRRLKIKYALSACTHSTNVFKKLFQTENVLEIGYPRNDILLNPEVFTCENISEELGLKDFKKIFLYAPTHRKKSRALNPFNKQFMESRDTPSGRKVGQAVNPFDERFLGDLNCWLQQNNFIFLIKQHPYVRNVDGLDKFSNIQDVSIINHDIQELAIHTDILISDYSSIVFDFALTEKPIIFYPYDYDDYTQGGIGLYFDYYKKLPGPFAKTQQELLELMKNAETWSADEDYLRRYKSFKNEFNHHQDGCSCQRLFDLLLEIKK
jgi:CDP-glycerol glycerophosphotransferase